MKIAYKHIIRYIPCKPKIEELSSKLFQLGHEHEIIGNIFDMEFTPNRGDCLSLNGILRDLKVFYDVSDIEDIYLDKLKPMNLEFNNRAKEICPNISFLKIDIQGKALKYKSYLNDYFNELSINKNNFFTDISNYVSYETGQPTHCYDFHKIDAPLSLEKIEGEYNFETLINKSINLTGENLVFLNGEEIINLAGIMGGKSTSCSSETNSVLIECAYFKPEEILGKTVTYDIQSEAAHKFERGVDPSSQEKVLRRFVQIVADHVDIDNIEFFNENNISKEQKVVNLDIERINKIIGISLNKKEYIEILEKLNFKVNGNQIHVPEYRSDIKTENDISEEVARVIGYDEIKEKTIHIPRTKEIIKKNNNELALKSILIDEGFFEVINHPFIPEEEENSIKIDNPLDSNRRFLRQGLKNNLLDNLLYNERRQKDIIKLFEISDVYDGTDVSNPKKLLGMICSGKKGKNYKDFSKIINEDYLIEILKEFLPKRFLNVKKISRENLQTKNKHPIYFLEIALDEISQEKILYSLDNLSSKKTVKVNRISEFPSSKRDLSFSIKVFSKSQDLQEFILNYKHEYLKEAFIFDYFYNKKFEEIKIGFRFIFQDLNKTLKDDEIDIVMHDLINNALTIEGVEIPGLS